jgi:dTDP-4-amino-4,6-dideoxygalactose transaminase
MCLDALNAVPAADYDGVILTNPFGLHTDFSRFIELQASSGVPLIIDNAAGIRPDIPDLPYQIFSLHHTKPFGAGEGGLIVVPDEDYELVLSLLEYTPIQEQHLPHWVTNGKISDLACAAHLVRLEAEPEWRPLYTMQATRIINIACSHGFKPLMAPSLPLMSIPFIATNPVKQESLQNDYMTLGKYYKPLAITPNCNELYKRLVNVPCHPDVAALSREQIDDVLEHLKN